MAACLPLPQAQASSLTSICRYLAMCAARRWGGSHVGAWDDIKSGIGSNRKSSPCVNPATPHPPCAASTCGRARTTSNSASGSLQRRGSHSSLWVCLLACLHACAHQLWGASRMTSSDSEVVCLSLHTFRCLASVIFILLWKSRFEDSVRKRMS